MSSGPPGATTGRVVVVGSVNVDLVARVSRLPLPGETVGGGTFARYHGGKGANQAVAAARFGASVSFVGAVGDDSMGVAARQALEAEGIELSGLHVHTDTTTGVALITVDADGENQIAVAPGANARLDAAAVRQSLDGRLRGPGVLLMNLEIGDEALLAAAKLARAAGLVIVLNPAPARAIPDSLLEMDPLLVLNEGEVMRLAPAEDVESSAYAVAGRTGAPVVVTLGRAGALLVDGGRSQRIPGHQVDVVDTTGAGDTACGVLAAELAAGRLVEEALRAAMAAAALSVMVHGARVGMPSRSEVESFVSGRG